MLRRLSRKLRQETVLFSSEKARIGLQFELHSATIFICFLYVTFGFVLIKALKFYYSYFYDFLKVADIANSCRWHCQELLFFGLKGVDLKGRCTRCSKLIFKDSNVSLVDLKKDSNHIQVWFYAISNTLTIRLNKLIKKYQL